MTDIVAFFHREARVWIVYAADAEGNQLWDADYYPNREALRRAFRA